MAIFTRSISVSVCGSTVSRRVIARNSLSLSLWRATPRCCWKKAFRRILASFDTTGRVVVVSTHQVADLNNLLSAVVVLREGRMVLNATFDAIAGKLSFGGPSAPDAFYADGLRSISLNRDGEYTDVDVESLYHAIHESERVRSFIAENFSGSIGSISDNVAGDFAGKEDVC